MKYVVVIEKMGDNYGAYTPDIDGCIATGETAEQCLKNMKDAIVWHLDDEPSIPVAKGIDYWLSQIDEIAHPHAFFTEINLETSMLVVH
jgi:predicted RNase H-like HicB family nuclease